MGFLINITIYLPIPFLISNWERIQTAMPCQFIHTQKLIIRLLRMVHPIFLHTKKQINIYTDLEFDIKGLISDPQNFQTVADSHWKILEMGYLRIQPAVMDEVMCLGPKFYPPSYDLLSVSPLTRYMYWH